LSFTVTSTFAQLRKYATEVSPVSGVYFFAPLMAGLVADRYGLPAALNAIAIFPLLAATICFLVVKPAAQSGN
jgi:hypothetical protein